MPEETSFKHKLSPVLHGFLQQQHRTAAGGSLLGAAGHLGLETQTLEGQSKVGEGPECDPAG